MFEAQIQPTFRLAMYCISRIPNYMSPEPVQLSNQQSIEQLQLITRPRRGRGVAWETSSRKEPHTLLPSLFLGSRSASQGSPSRGCQCTPCTAPGLILAVSHQRIHPTEREGGREGGRKGNKKAIQMSLTAFSNTITDLSYMYIPH